MGMALVMLLLTLTGMLTACRDATTPDDTPKPEEPEKFGYADDFSYYQELVMNPDKHLYVYNRTETLTNEESVLAEAIQGIYARTGAKYYRYSNGAYATWFDDMIENYGFTAEDITLGEMVEGFIRDYGNKYVLYDWQGLAESINSACTIAGALDYLPVDVTLREKAEGWGLTLGVDASAMTEKECFTAYKDKLSNTGLVQQSAGNICLRDYGIACRYFFFYRAGNETEDMMFRGQVHAWVEENSPVFGWGPNEEAEHVTVSSQYGQFTIPSDHCFNMTVYACRAAFGGVDFTQSAKTTGVRAEAGKHYVCIMMSDGDNVQTWYNTFPFNSKYFGAERGDFPMGWSVQPSLSDLGPNVLGYLKRNAGAKDYFVCSVSGQGYMYPQIYPDLKGFTQGLSAYLRRTDLSVVQILDSGYSAKVVEAYAQIPELKGAIYCYGDKYVAGNGSVYWSNGKPFVAIRETLWNANVEAMAERINGYAKDPTTIEGYTAINLHPWSMSYQDVVKLVELLDDDVVIVTADDFIQLITENVPKTDVVR